MVYPRFRGLHVHHCLRSIRPHPHRRLRPLAVAAASGLPAGSRSTTMRSTASSTPSACRLWGYTTDDFQRRSVFPTLTMPGSIRSTRRMRAIFAAEQGYDLVDDNGMLTDWWGYCWMILAEKARAADAGKTGRQARAAIEEKIPDRAERDRRHRRALSLLNLGPLSPSMTRPSAPQPVGQARPSAAHLRQTAFHSRPFLRLPAPPSFRRAVHGTSAVKPG